jgi:UDP:flavonoid glycosyltransferase YjiC (YdhE family)
MIDMKILVASLGAYGHLYPMMPLALACSEAGHEVTIAVGEPFLGRLPLPTVPCYPPHHDLDSTTEETRRRHPDLQGVDLSRAMFADVTAGEVIPTLIEHCTADRPDLIIFEGMNTGAGVAAHVLGIPSAAYAIGLSSWIFFGILHPATVGYHRDVWLQRGKTPPDGDRLLAAALIDPVPPMLRNPRLPAGLPPVPAPGQGQRPVPTIPIRPIAYSEDAAEVPAWLTGERTRPRIYVTLGTVAFGAVEVLGRAVRETAALDVDVLVTVGPEGDPAAIGELPGNVHVERFVAQSKVLPLVDLIVHHGGTGTVLSALEAGLPQLILPQGADQFINAATLPAVGVARALPNDAQQPGAIRAAVQALLHADAPERTAAARVREEIAALPHPVDVVPALVDLSLGVRT